jgi:hypothetical protein
MAAAQLVAPSFVDQCEFESKRDGNGNYTTTKTQDCMKKDCPASDAYDKPKT